jgi:phytanoyl-CoA hydroxylase
VETRADDNRDGDLRMSHEDQADVVANTYRRDGFIAINRLLSASEIADLRQEAVAIARGDRGPVIGTEPGDVRSDEHIIGDILAIHFPHKISLLMREAMAHPRVVDVLKTLIGPNIKAMQTMLFVKKAGMPGQAWHQDEHYIATRDRSLCGAWIALEDATTENGCLWMHPGSHAPGILYPTHRHDDERFDPSDEAFGHPFEREGGRPVELKAGGVAFFNGYVLHRSLPNYASTGFRRALVTHYMSANSLLPWTTGTSGAAEDVRDIVMISGEDPYAWKGIEDLNIPYVRPENPEKVARVYSRLAAIARDRRKRR